MAHRTTLTQMGEGECHSHLRSAAVGRLAYVENGMLVVRPVNFSFVGDSDVIWTVPGAGGASVAGQAVAFEVDEIDSGSRTGWTVLATGQAEAVTDVNDLVASVDIARRPWVSVRGDQVVRLRLTGLSGLRLHPAVAAATPTTSAGPG